MIRGLPQKAEAACGVIDDEIVDCVQRLGTIETMLIGLELVSEDLGRNSM